MTEGYRASCLCRVDRLGNDELRALMAEVVKHDRAAFLQLMATVTPLLIAFYEGQVQAGSITVKDVQGLVQETFVALYQRNTSDDLTLPFRAWLIETARCTQLNYMRSEREKAVGVPLAAAPAFNRDEALSAT